jgi:uncharacterized OsmC-like protein
MEVYKIMINRVNVEKFKETVENAKKDPSIAQKTIKIEGIWRLNEQTGPQFETKLGTENAGEKILQTDEPTGIGGGGTSFNPVQLCIAGLIACYAATFAKWAAVEGVILKNFKIMGTANMDMSAAFGIADKDALKNLQMELIVESETDIEKLREINQIAKERCPGYYCVSHAITPQIDVRKS